jgi:hypothetical protein
LVITYSAKAAKAAKAAGVDSVAFVDDVTVTRTTLKWLAARVTLLAGWPTLLMDPATALIEDPSSYFVRDSDVEAASDGWDDVTAYGYDHVVDDPEMDWSRFCHGGRVLTADPGFTLLMPTEESAKLASLVAGRSEARFLGSKQSVTKTADSDFEHLVFNEAVFSPVARRLRLTRGDQTDAELHVLRQLEAHVSIRSQGSQIQGPEPTRADRGAALLPPQRTQTARGRVRLLPQG